MKDTVYIVVNKNGIDRMLKTGTFQLKAGEKAFALVLDVPDGAFKPPPMPTVKMTIPLEALIHEINITADTAGKP